MNSIIAQKKYYMKIQCFNSFLYHRIYINDMRLPHKKETFMEQNKFEHLNKISYSIQFVLKLVTKSLCLRQFLNLPRDLSFLINTGKSFQSLRAFKKKELNILEE